MIIILKVKMTEKKRGIKNEPKSVMVSLKEFSRDSVNFFEKCKKPSKKEYF